MKILICINNLINILSKYSKVGQTLEELSAALKVAQKENVIQK